MQRVDATLGTWSTFINTANGDFANLLTLTGSGVTLNLTGLTGGQYRVLTYNTSLLATGSYTSLDVDVHRRRCQRADRQYWQRDGRRRYANRNIANISH